MSDTLISHVENRVRCRVSDGNREADNQLLGSKASVSQPQYQPNISFLQLDSERSKQPILVIDHKLVNCFIMAQQKPKVLCLSYPEFTDKAYLADFETKFELHVSLVSRRYTNILSQEYHIPNNQDTSPLHRSPAPAWFPN